MITIDVDPVLVHLGPVMLSWYSLAVALGLFVGVWLTLVEARRKGIPTEPIFDSALWAVGGGLVGARLLHVIDRWDFYSANPTLIPAVQNGGLAILGAIIGGALAGGIAAWRLGLPIRRVFDAAAPGVVLGQAIGRLGCLITGDALGPATDGSWGIVYQNSGAMAPRLGVAYQPTFLYEAGWDLAVFALLWAIRRRDIPSGYLFALYAALYAAGKFGLTFLRAEAVWFWGLQEPQILALAVIAAAAAWSLWNHRQNAGASAA
ncbi:MAG: prolipoprotein diacylglyceryl transferase [Chloroflexota bacterium]|nr:MAG: prolipoprotein diacylglyceryl transferase [Chloroflexota bacterium]